MKTSCRRSSTGAERCGSGATQSATGARVEFDAHIANQHTDASGNLTKIGPILELWVTPRFPARQLCLQEELQQHLNQAGFRWRRVEFLGAGSQSITAYQSVIIRDRLDAGSTSMFSVDVWGTCFYATRIAVEVTNVARVVHRHSSSIGERIGDGFSASRRQNTQTARILSVRLVVRVTLKSVRGLHWLYGSGSAVMTNSVRSSTRIFRSRFLR